MTTLDVLREARKLVEDSRNWTQWAMARAAGGFNVDPLDGSACSFCAEGAVIRACGLSFHPAFGALRRANDGESVSGVNDDAQTSHADILALFDRAIAAEREKLGAAESAKVQP